MKTTTHRWTPQTDWIPPLPEDGNTSLVITFGPAVLDEEWHTTVRNHFRDAEFVYASGGGQMLADPSTELFSDDDVVLAAIQFDDVTIHARQVFDVTRDTSVERAAELVAEMPTLPAGSHVFVFTEGIDVRGDRFIQSLRESLPVGVSISGGLSSNGLALTNSVVGLNSAPVRNSAVVVALHGPKLKVSCAVAQGWSPFGPTRYVTHSEGSVVAQLDNEPALGLYRRYLGPFAEELPGSALLFPLAVNVPGTSHEVVRSILGIDDSDGTMAFAGDVEMNSSVRLMRTSEDQLIDSVEIATRAALEQMGDVPTELALCVSCIGRNAVLRSRTDEEVASCRAIAEVPRIIGFYSNGEFGPAAADRPATGQAANSVQDFVMHNQSMTITLLGEG